MKYAIALVLPCTSDMTLLIRKYTVYLHTASLHLPSNSGKCSQVLIKQDALLFHLATENQLIRDCDGEQVLEWVLSLKDRQMHCQQYSLNSTALGGPEKQGKPQVMDGSPQLML